MDKFEPLRKANTNGANYDLDTPDVIARLEQWDARFGLQLSDVSHDTVVVTFEKLPQDVNALAAEIYDFCPDTVDQHFGCFAEMVELANEVGHEVPPETLQLIEGVDLEQEGYGVELLKRSIEKNQRVTLWWD